MRRIERLISSAVVAIAVTAATTPGALAEAAFAPSWSGDGVHRPSRGLMAAGGDRLAFVEAIARALNLRTSELVAQAKAGKSLRDVARARAVPFGAVQAAAVAALKPRLDEAVRAGTISASREELELQRIQSEAFGSKGRPAAPRRPTRTRR